VQQPPLAGLPRDHHPSPGKTVVPADFAGSYHLDANGQWSGRLELKVDDASAVTGRFRSDQTGNSYAVTGRAAFETPHRIVFSIELPRSRLEFDGRLWTEGKHAIAGTVQLLNRDYGFYAVRDEPAAADTPAQDAQDTPPSP
jgi:hypothetical protein